MNPISLPSSSAEFSLGKVILWIPDRSWSDLSDLSDLFWYNPYNPPGFQLLIFSTFIHLHLSFIFIALNILESLNFGGNETMLPPVPNPSDFGITSDYGFLPPELPLEILPDTYYAKWENIIGNLHHLILSKRLQSVVDRLPILSVTHLQTDAEWRRAYVILVFILHGYVWGGNTPTEVPAHPPYWSPSKKK